MQSKNTEVCITYLSVFALHAILLSSWLDALRPSHKVVDESANHRDEEYKEQPGNLIIPLGRFFRDTLIDDPDPEDHSYGEQAVSSQEQEI